MSNRSPKTTGEHLVALYGHITGLTHTENALLSNEEKAMRLRQRGMA